jgi:hypothetical protein
MRFGKLVPVPADASDEDVERYQRELQNSLDRIREFAEENVSKVGDAEFPCYKAHSQERLTSTAAPR